MSRIVFVFEPVQALEGYTSVAAVDAFDQYLARLYMNGINNEVK